MSKKKKIMTISDLYKFCIKNNFCHFSSSTNNEEICVQMPAIFKKEDNVDKDKEGLTPFVAKAYHDHINLNNSEIKPEVLESTLPSAMLRPILASIVTDEETGEKDFGSHDFVFEEDGNGNEKIKYIEQPVGVIFGDNTIEYDEEDDVNRAILHGYLYNEYCQDAVDIMNRRKTVDCSVELSIREMSFNTADKVLTLDDFYVCGLTLLGSKVQPGMKGSKVTIEDFSKANNSLFTKYENQLIEFQARLEKLESTCANTYYSKEGGNETNMFEKLLEKYGKTVEDITFDYAELSDEELEAKFAEMFEEAETDTDGSGDEPSTDGEGDGTADPETDTNTDDGGEGSDDGDNDENSGDGEDNEQFEKLVRTFEISHEDVRYALYSLLDSFEEMDNEWYWISNVYDSYFVYENWEGTKIYRQDYSKDGDNVAFENERVELFKELLTASEKAELDTMRSNYAVLKEFKENVEKNELTAQKNELINSEKYAVIAEKNEEGKYTNEAFAKLVSEMDNYSLAELETQIKVIHSDFMAENSNFSAKPESKMSSVKVFANPNKKAKPKKRYGNLFD